MGLRALRRAPGARTLPGLIAFAILALVAVSAAAHTGERGFILLLPTGLVQVGGTVVVAVSFFIVALCPAGRLRSWLESTRWTLCPLARRSLWLNSLSSAALIGLIVVGFAGSRDPLANPLPLSVWTLAWVGLTLAHAVFGELWPCLNPWAALAAIARRLAGLRAAGGVGPLACPEWLGQWPAVGLLFLFGWFELVHPAPQDPAVLAEVVLAYSVFTVTGMVLFGDAVWNERVEVFSRFFRMVSWVAPLQWGEAGGGGPRKLVLMLPGSRLLSVGTLPVSGVAFVILALAIVSFDGLSRTFWWLHLLGENPLEHPGRTDLVSRNSLGLLGASLSLFAAYSLCAVAGALGSRTRPLGALRGLVVSIVPIAFGYHFAHYLPSFLVDAQYALKALSDPLGQGWNLLGARDLHVTASFLSHHASVTLIWYLQVGAIVGAHVAAVVVAHALMGEQTQRHFAPAVAGAPLAGLMIAYTLFGLWLLSSPVAA